MKIERTLDTNCDALFALITESIKKDIESAIGESIDIATIKKGYTYKKRIMGKTGKLLNATATIEIFEKPTLYQISFETVYGINKISYQLSSIDTDQTALVYEESYDAPNKRLSLNASILNFFYHKSSRKRVVNMLDLMEQHLKSQKES